MEVGSDTTCASARTRGRHFFLRQVQYPLWWDESSKSMMDRTTQTLCSTSHHMESILIIRIQTWATYMQLWAIIEYYHAVGKKTSDPWSRTDVSFLASFWVWLQHRTAWNMPSSRGANWDKLVCCMSIGHGTGQVTHHSSNLLTCFSPACKVTELFYRFGCSFFFFLSASRTAYITATVGNSVPSPRHWNMIYIHITATVGNLVFITHALEHEIYLFKQRLLLALSIRSLVE